jgi:hypothetical protein
VHVRIVIIEVPDNFTGDDAYDCIALGFNAESMKVLDDVTEYHNVLPDAIVVPTDAESVL